MNILLKECLMAVIMTRILLSTTRSSWSVTGLMPQMAITGSLRTPGAQAGGRQGTSSSRETLSQNVAQIILLLMDPGVWTGVWRVFMSAELAPYSVTTHIPLEFTS